MLLENFGQTLCPKSRLCNSTKIYSKGREGMGGREMSKGEIRNEVREGSWGRRVNQGEAGTILRHLI